MHLHSAPAGLCAAFDLFTLNMSGSLKHNAILLIEVHVMQDVGRKPEMMKLNAGGVNPLSDEIDIFME